jgi:hypothetical protein
MIRTRVQHDPKRPGDWMITDVNTEMKRTTTIHGLTWNAAMWLATRDPYYKRRVNDHRPATHA